MRESLPEADARRPDIHLSRMAAYQVGAGGRVGHEQPL